MERLSVGRHTLNNMVLLPEKASSNVPILLPGHLPGLVGAEVCFKELKSNAAKRHLHAEQASRSLAIKPSWRQYRWYSSPTRREVEQLVLVPQSELSADFPSLVSQFSLRRQTPGHRAVVPRKSH